MNKEKEFEEKILNKLLVDLKDIDKYKSFKNGSFIYDLGYYQGNLLINEIERLNNIIDELENTIANFIENHTESYIDWKYDREIYLAECNILQKLCDTYFDKLKELKENNKDV